jgi:hypothetical protein
MIPKRKKIVTLTFLRDELLYDIKNYAYIEGDVMKTDDEHDRHQVMDIGEEGNIDRVTRVLDLAIAECIELCYPYSKINVPDTSQDDEEEEVMSLDDTLEETPAYVVRLLVPDDFSQTTVNLLRRLIHELLVYKVVADWMSITNPDKAALWQAKVADTEEAIRTNLNCRVGRVRRTMTPFA